MPLGAGSIEGLDHGMHGSTIVSAGDSAITGNYGRIDVLADAVFSVLVSATFPGSSTELIQQMGDTIAINSITVAAGASLRGHWTSVRVSTGAVAVYNNGE